MLALQAVQSNESKPESTTNNRESKDFTRKSKAEVIDSNKQKNGGKTVCEGCKVETTKPEKSKKGVTPPTTDRQVDHVKPKSKNGSGTPNIGQVLCRGCNIESDKDPVKRNYILAMEKILFEYYDLNKEYAVESAWAEKAGNYYKLNNLLFYAPNYSWGDIVNVEDRNEELFVTGLVEESGHSTIRIIFYNEENIDPTIEQLKYLGCDYEGSNVPTLISVDVPPQVNYANVRQFLDEGEENGMWSYQESCLAHK